MGVTCITCCAQDLFDASQLRVPTFEEVQNYLHYSFSLLC